MKQFLKISTFLFVVVSIAFVSSCKTSTNATFTGISVEYDNIFTEEGAKTLDEVVTVIANYSDGSIQIIENQFCSFENTETEELYDVSDIFNVGPNPITATYRDKSFSFVVYRASQELTNSISEIAASDSYSQKTTKRYFKFGDYAQEKATSIPQSISEKPAPNGWYVGSDGKYYGKVEDELYAVTPIIWCEVTNSFDYDGHNEDSEAKDACENKASLLIAESILDADVPYYYSTEAYYTANNLEEAKAADGKIRVINDKDIFTSNYEYSQLRAFLIGENYIDLNNKTVSTYKGCGLLQKAFSEAAQTKLETVTVLNDGKNGTENCEYGYQTLFDSKLPLSSANTNDKVFALSMYELGDPAHGFGHGNEGGAVINGRRLRTPSEYAKAKGSINAYWQRTPYYKNGCSLRYVNGDGRTYLNTLASDLTVGVVPAIVVDMNK